MKEKIYLCESTIVIPKSSSTEAFISIGSDSKFSSTRYDFSKDDNLEDALIRVGFSAYTQEGNVLLAPSDVIRTNALRWAIEDIIPYIEDDDAYIEWESTTGDVYRWEIENGHLVGCRQITSWGDTQPLYDGSALG